MMLPSLLVKDSWITSGIFRQHSTPRTLHLRLLIKDAAASSWIRLSIRHTTASQWTLGQIGNRKFQRKGLIIGQIFTPLNIGRQLSDQLVQRFKDVFEGVNFDAVECYTANVKEMVTEGLWFPVAVQVDFNYNELK